MIISLVTRVSAIKMAVVEAIIWKTIEINKDSI